MFWELLPLLVIVAIAYLLIVRPAKRRQQAMATMQSALEVDSPIMLTSGFYGTVRVLHEDRIEVELAPGVVITVARGAVASVLPVETGAASITSTPVNDPEEG